LDLNRLYHDHQVLLIKARGAATPDLRRQHQSKAQGLAGRIGHEQGKLGAAAACAWVLNARGKAA